VLPHSYHQTREPSASYLINSTFIPVFESASAISSIVFLVGKSSCEHQAMRLNPFAQEWAPGLSFGGAAPAQSCAAAAAAAASSAAGGGGGIGQGSSAAAVAALSILTGAALSPPSATAEQQQPDLPTPNGLAELASVLSSTTSADMTFEELMFDNSSRRGSVSVGWRLSTC
jgi:hypothetical protein